YARLHQLCARSCKAIFKHEEAKAVSIAPLTCGRSVAEGRPVAMSASGPSATSLGEPGMPLSGGEAVVPQTSAEVRVWSQRCRLALSGFWSRSGEKQTCSSQFKTTLMTHMRHR